MQTPLSYLPERTTKPRKEGLTMMMDKGFSVKEAECFTASSADYTDFVKLGFGTALITKDLEKKLQVYKEANLRCYFGGTLFEAFVVRGQFDEYRKFIDQYGLDLAEVSDGSIKLDHEEKLEYIEKLAGQVDILSEVGYKVAGIEIKDEEWVSRMKTELEAGAWKVIAEARESGTIGIYNKDGSVNSALIDDIVAHIHPEDVIWEAPNKNQQVYFIKLLGSNVNLGNIAPAEVVSLETLRLGLRGDTFFEFLPDKFQDRRL